MLASEINIVLIIRALCLCHAYNSKCSIEMHMDISREQACDLRHIIFPLFHDLFSQSYTDLYDRKNYQLQ